MLHQKTIDDLLTIHQIYLEPDVPKYERGREILTKYPHFTLDRTFAVQWLRHVLLVLLCAQAQRFCQSYFHFRQY